MINKKQLDDIPRQSGVYLYKNFQSKVIYVGKAAVLRNRVRQYWQNSRKSDPKTDALVRDVADIDWIVTDTEADALFLEAELIKRYKPKYNIALRDDKSNIFIRLDINGQHPTVSYTRRPLDDGAEYFGPYHDVRAIKRAMRYLRKVFPYDTRPSTGKKVSLNYHIGLSPGLEQKMTTLTDYRADLRKLRSYLKGNRVKLLNQLEKDMKVAAKNQDFEKAAKFRNQLSALQALRRHMIFGREEFMDSSSDTALSELAKLVGLKSIPVRIEGFDISHMSGAHNVASMVVFTNGIPDKAQYRKFKMKTAGNDDFAHMKEVLSRRYSEKNIKRWGVADLILIDGGKGQLGVAQQILELKNISVPAIGLAKRQETIILKNHNNYQEVNLGQDSEVTKLLQRIRDESHRFAVSYHSTIKTKSQTKSLLEDIPTIGPATRKKLIRTFGSVRGIRQARQWELEKIVGVAKAKILRQYLAKQKLEPDA